MDDQANQVVQTKSRSIMYQLEVHLIPDQNTRYQVLTNKAQGNCRPGTRPGPTRQQALSSRYQTWTNKVGTCHPGTRPEPTRHQALVIQVPGLDQQGTRHLSSRHEALTNKAPGTCHPGTRPEPTRLVLVIQVPGLDQQGTRHLSSRYQA